MRSVMFLSLLLCTICPFVLPSSAVPRPGPTADENSFLQVTIPRSPPVSAVLGGSMTLPCLVSLPQPSPTPSSPGRHAVLTMPRVKWSVHSSGRETEILVARGERVKVSELYKGRASLLNYALSPADLTLQLDGLRHNDTGFYRCEVQQGLEDAHDLVQIRVKGVVFHYRHASSRYAFSFDEAKDACEDIGAQIATPEQLLAAYNSGYEQCDAGWLADGSVRYPIQMPREGCFGDMDGLPGVRNYGMMDVDELFDVYCYIENIHGEVFHGSTPQRFTLAEAKAYCEQQGAELASTSQLYAAWNDGLNHCSPGWLADGSVRYPIVIPRERCGGSDPGVKTVYRFGNQTGFPEPHTHHDAYCFRGNLNSHTVTPVDFLATEPEDIGQDIVTLTDPQEEFSLGHVTEHTQNEALGAVETYPIYSEQTPTESDKHEEATPTLSDEVYTSTADSKILTTTASYDWQPKSTQNVWQDVLTNPIEFKSAPEVHLEPNHEDEIEDPDTENSTATYVVKSHNHKHYQPMPNTNLESGEELEYKIYIERKPETTFEILEPATEFREIGGSKHFQPMPETNLDEQEESQEYEHQTVMQPHEDNTTEPSRLDEDLDHTTIKGSKDEVTTQSTEISSLITLTQADLNENSSSEATTENFLATEPEDIGQDIVTLTDPQEEFSLGHVTEHTANEALGAVETYSIYSFTPTHEESGVTDTYSTVNGVDQEAGHTSAESIVVSVSSADVESNHTIGVTITPTPGEEKEADSTDGSGDHDDVLLVTLLTTPAPHMWGTSITQKAEVVETSSVVPVGSTPTELITVVEEKVVQVEQEGLGVAPNVFNTTNTSLTETETTSINEDSSHEDDASGQEESSGGRSTFSEYPDLNDSNTTTVAPFNSTDLLTLNTTYAVNQTDVINNVDVTETPLKSSTTPSTVDVTLLPAMTPTPSWDVLTPHTPPQESQGEFSGNGPLFIDNPDSSVESNFTASSTTKEPEKARSPSTTTMVDNEESEEYDLTTADENSSENHEVTTRAHPPHITLTTTATQRVVVRTGISDGCVKNPCANGGTCVDSGAAVKCLCLPTYGGDFCQTDLEQCEPGWDKFQGSCYKHFSKRQSWEVAEQHCRMCGAHLVSVMSPEEQHFINEKYREYQWTGLNDRTIEGDFHWSDGNPLLYENWYRGQPDSYFLSGEDCVVMVWHDGGRWSDVPCNYHLAYTCKKGIAFCGPPPVVLNAKLFRQPRQRYEANAQIRYYCEAGFLQRHNPIITCHSNGQWEEPQITCTPAEPAESNGDHLTLPTLQNQDPTLIEDTATEKQHHY